MSEELSTYLRPAVYMDSAHPAVIAYASRVTQSIEGDIPRSVALYAAIRDGFQYNPYRIDLRPPALKASALLSRDYGYCVEKANLLGACARALGIPSRLGFANVRNHIGTARLEQMLRTDVLVFHGYVELYLQDHWVKATPAFNAALCRRLNVAPLNFDGKHDSLFQEYDHAGSKFMEYLHDYGTFPDVPRELFIRELKKYYPHIFEHPQPYSDELYIMT